MSVRVPATSANLGPGFDVLGLALSLYAEVGVVDADPMPSGASVADETHPAHIAFARAGGVGRIWVRNAIPMGRGLGFSGAVRVGGIIAAEIQQVGSAWNRESSRALEIGTELEGHADNVAPSLHGGVVITSENTVVQVPVSLSPTFVMWIPDFTTSTNESRGKIGPTIALNDAVFNIAHCAMFVTALTTGNVRLLKEATRDRIHQDIRFASSPACKEALTAGLNAGAWCGWLSGSGPTVAIMCAAEQVSDISKALPEGGRTEILHIDFDGAVVL
jgi:homoserine kinase